MNPVAHPRRSRTPTNAPSIGVTTPGVRVAHGGVDALSRPEVRGKFLFAGEEKLIIRGVTYGPFRPEPDGCEYHTPERVNRDFRMMAAARFNTVRLYTVPPLWLLDAAKEHGLRVMVGLPWEQHVTFLDDPGRARDIERRVRQAEW